MATKKNLILSSAELPEAKILAPATATPLPAFTRLVTGAQFALNAERAFAKSQDRPVLTGTPAITAAWDCLTQPKNMLGFLISLPMTQKNIDNNHRYYYQREDSSPLGSLSDHLQALLGNCGDEELATLAQGLDALAHDVLNTMTLPSFDKAGRAASIFLASPSSKDLLSYPAIGAGLTPSFGLIDGKRCPTLSASRLAYASTTQIPTQNEHILGILAPVDPDNELRQEVLNATTLAQSHPDNWSKFASAGIAVQPAILSGDVPLPSVSSMLGAWKSGMQERTVSKLSPFSKVALSLNTDMGFTAVSPRNLFTSQRSPLAVAEVANSWTHALSSAWALNSLKNISKTAHPTSVESSVFSQVIRNLDLDPDKAKLISFLRLHAKSIFDTPNLEESLTKVGINNSYAHYQPIRTTLTLLQALALNDDMARKTDSDSHKPNWMAPGDAMRAMIAQALNSAEPQTAKSRGNASPGSSSLEQLCGSLKAADGRLGLLQLSVELLRVQDLYPKIKKIKPGQDLPADQTLERSAKFSPLIASMDQLSQAYSQAKNTFILSALDEAALVEASWVESRGLGPAWSQATAGGQAPSAKSIAWAGANPVAESLASLDPLARLAAQCARGLGLRAKAGEAELIASLREELVERGASELSLDALAGQPRVVSIIASLAEHMAGADKKKSAAAAGALSFVAVAMSHAAHGDVSGADLSDFLSDYLIDPILKPGASRSYELPRLELFSTRAGGLNPAFDGLCPGLSTFGLSTAQNARLAQEVCTAKTKGFPDMVDSLLRDWTSAAGSAAKLGQPRESCVGIANARAQEIRGAYPREALMDWRLEPFKQRESWEIFGMPSPRFSAAVADAMSRGGALGEWCATRARALGVLDAIDGNDLVAKSREVIKERCQMTDGAWRLAIKDVNILHELTESLELPPSQRKSNNQACLIRELTFEQDGRQAPIQRKSITDVNDARIHSDAGETAGIAIKAASAVGLNPALTGKVLGLLSGHLASRTQKASLALFSNNIKSVVAEGAQGADFFLREKSAKNDRMPKVFIECCKRFEKIESDLVNRPRAVVPGEAVQSAMDIFSAEVGDLCDWIDHSEHGLWSEMPRDPTFGQLTRMSKAWHEEQHAMAVDAADRLRVKSAVSEAVYEAEMSANPFAQNPGSRWGKVLGKFGRDGWEAIEMQTAADLASEGASMHHCVSSYSPKCRSGSLRIFSIRLNGERKCTLEISSEKPLSELDANATFHISQNKGPSNQAVTNAATSAFCEDTLAKFQDTWPVLVQKILTTRQDKRLTKDLAKRVTLNTRAQIEAERGAENHSKTPSFSKFASGI